MSLLITTFPESAISFPNKILSKADFPLPFLATMAILSPSLTLKEIFQKSFQNAVRFGKIFCGNVIHFIIDK